MGGAVSAVTDAVGGAIDKVGDIGQSVVDTVKSHPLEAAALGAAGWYFQPELSAWLNPEAGKVVAGTATGADLSAAYDMGEVGALGAGGAAAGSALSSAAGAGAGAGLLGGLSGLGGTLSNYALPAAITASALTGANAAKEAAATQAAALDRANQLAYQMYGEQKALQQPFVQGGVTAQNRLMDVLGLSGNTGAADYGIANKNFTPSDLTTDPSYSFRLNEGLKALDRQAAARGGLISGGALKAAQEYGQQSASQEYQNAFNRYQTNRSNLLQPLGNLISTGQSAAANVGSAAGNYSNTASNNLTSAGAAQAAGNVGSANALTSGLGQYLNYSGNQDLLNTIRQSAYK